MQANINDTRLCPAKYFSHNRKRRRMLFPRLGPRSQGSSAGAERCTRRRHILTRDNRPRAQERRHGRDGPYAPDPARLCHQT